MQPRCGIVQNLLNSIPVMSRQADPTVGKQFYALQDCPQISSTREQSLGVGRNLFWKVVRDEGYLRPGRAEASSAAGFCMEG